MDYANLELACTERKTYAVHIADSKQVRGVHQGEGRHTQATRISVPACLYSHFFVLYRITPLLSEKMGFLPDVVVGVDFGMTSTGIAYSAGPEWAVRIARHKISFHHLALNNGRDVGSTSLQRRR